MASTNSVTMFPAEIVRDLFSKVRGKSSLAVLGHPLPTSFTGVDMFTFAMDEEANLVGEGGEHGAGKSAVEPVQMRPLKIEYGTRVSEEFMKASNDQMIAYLKEFNTGFSAKLARALDIMAMHGLNPRSDTTSPLITNYLDKGNQTVTFVDGKGHDNIEAASALLGDYDVTGVAIAKTMAADLAKMETKNGGKMYPELAWGGQPDNLNGVPASVNTTVSFGKATKDMAIIGDFANMFKWGYGEEIKLEVIPYGDPDNTGKDLKGHGQVYIRAQAYVGFGILDLKAFARVVKGG